MVRSEQSFANSLWCISISDCRHGIKDKQSKPTAISVHKGCAILSLAWPLQHYIYGLPSYPRPKRPILLNKLCPHTKESPLADIAIYYSPCLALMISSVRTQKL